MRPFLIGGIYIHSAVLVPQQFKRRARALGAASGIVRRRVVEIEDIGCPRKVFERQNKQRVKRANDLRALGHRPINKNPTRYAPEETIGSTISLERIENLRRNREQLPRGIEVAGVLQIS